MVMYTMSLEGHGVQHHGYTLPVHHTPHRSPDGGTPLSSAGQPVGLSVALRGRGLTGLKS